MLRVQRLCETAIRRRTRGTNSCALRGKSLQSIVFLLSSQITSTYFGHKKAISTSARQTREIAASNAVSNRLFFGKVPPCSKTCGLYIAARDGPKKSSRVRL